jgi:23S rRNA pseudouridine1911/1915/1917 synthase
VLVANDDVVVLNKPGWVVCHPSKDGPFSSLVGAAREVLGLERVHLVSRLDRETSGLVVLARHREMARRLQMAIAGRRVRKHYLAILEGHLPARLEVSQPIGPDESSAVAVKQAVHASNGSQKAQTTFTPQAWRGGRTLAAVVPHTGRKHQIRVHAQWAGFPVAGDKLYGPDPALYLEFIAHGWTDRHAATLPLQRQALHSARLVFELEEGDLTWEAPLADDLATFWEALPAEDLPLAGPNPRRRRRA